MERLEQRRFARRLLLGALVLLAGRAGIRGAEPAAANLGHAVDFEKDVYPIFEANCIACHNAGIAESKLNLETADAARKGGKRGAAVVPMDPAASLLFQFASRAKQPAMPPIPNKVEANALSPKELGILKQWILEGARGGAGGAGETIQWQPIPSSMKSIESVAISPWGRFVAAGRANQIVIYDVILGQEVGHLIDPALSDVRSDGHPMYPGGAADRDFIHALAFSPGPRADESLLAAGGYRTVKFWKRPHNVHKASAMLPGDTNAISASSDGSLMAIATADKTIQLLAVQNDGKKLEPVRKLSGPAALITGLAFSPDGKVVYAGSLDKSWRAWSVVDGALRRSLTTPAPINAITLSKDGTQLLTAGADGVIRVWSLTGEKSSAAAPSAAAAPIRELKGHAKAVTTLALVLPAGKQVASASADGTIRVWDLASGKETLRFNHGGPVTAVAVRPDGQVIASAGADHRVRLWQTKEGKPLAEMKGDLDAARLVITRTEAQTMAAQHVVAADARVKAAEQDVKDRQEAAKKATDARAAAEKALVEATAKEKTADGALAGAKKASDAKPKDAGLKKKLDDAQKAVTAAAEATKAAKTAEVSAVRAKESADKTLQNVDHRLKETKADKVAFEAAKVRADKELAEATAAAAKTDLPIRALAFSADGKVLATAGDDRAIQLWDARTGRALDSFAGHSGPVGQLAFLGGTTLASSAADKRLILWDTNPPWTFAGRIGPKADAPLDLAGSPLVGRVLCLAFNSAGTLLATGGGEPSRSGELKIWNVPALALAREIKDAHSDTVFGVAFSRDGKYLASGAADKFVKVFDVATGKHVRSFEGHTHHVLGVAWKADGTLLASAGADNQIKIWNFESGEQARSIISHAKQVTSIEFIGTGQDVVTASGDKTVRLHHSSDGGNYRTFEGGTDFMYSAAATRDESLVAAGGEDGVLRIWNGANGQVLFMFGPPTTARDTAQASAAKR